MCINIYYYIHIILHNYYILDIYISTWYIYEGDPPKQNYLLEGGLLVVQAFPTSWVFWEPVCISVPAGIVVRGCIWLQWIFLEESSNTFAHFMMGDLRAHLPALHWVFSSFWQNGMTPVPKTPIHLISPQTASFVSLNEKKILKGKSFANMEEVKQKMAEAQKGIKISGLKNCFE